MSGRRIPSWPTSAFHRRWPQRLEYVEIAVRLATDAAFMREVRGAIHAGLASSPLTDMAAHTHHLEEAYRAALQMRAPAALADAESHAAADPAHGG